jgi:FtsH-binding integral membrane protein
MIETTPIPPFNRKAVLGFILAMLALLALCIGFLPIPFTILVCYPPGFVCGIAALVLGIQAQREISQSSESGKSLAVISVWAGVITIAAMLCVVTVGILLYPYIAELIKQILQSIHS